MSSSFSKRDLIWMLQLKAEICGRNGDDSGAAAIKDIATQLQTNSIDNITRLCQIQLGMGEKVSIRQRGNHLRVLPHV